jgi:hypothetical protein
MNTNRWDFINADGKRIDTVYCHTYKQASAKLMFRYGTQAHMIAIERRGPVSVERIGNALYIGKELTQ